MSNFMSIFRTTRPNCLLALAGLLATAPLLCAQDASEFFRQNCVSCHTIGGGRLTGPDLKSVTQRKDRAWLVEYLQNPQATMDKGDPYALKLKDEARGVIMPTISGMTPARAIALLDMLDAESKLKKSQFAGMQMSDAPFTPDDIAQGRRIFVGDRHLANGGPPCISCHTLRGLGGLGGGRLGPDLTRVYERLQGRKNMGAWLFAPATPTMGSVFKNHALRPEEIMPLVALFEDAARKGGQDDSTALLNFFLAGLGGAGVALVICDAAWRNRFRSVRRALVSRATRGQQ